MGAIAEAMVRYAQPLIDGTDGSEEQLNNAFQLSMLCYNLSLSPADVREELLDRLQADLDMDDEEFAVMRETVIEPMIRRSWDMFPNPNGAKGSKRRSENRIERGHSVLAGPELSPRDRTVPAGSPVVDRYAPCPCNSGRKYKFCCGAKGR